jgi:DNA-binding MarR family transcriptional regulator
MHAGLTKDQSPSIIEILQRRTTIAAEPAAEADVDRQSTQLVGFLETLFRRMMLNHKLTEEPDIEISREEVRAIIILDSQDRVTMSNLAESLGVPLSTATHTVDRLVSKGLVERNRSEEDRRVVEVQMSEYGRTLQGAFRDKRRVVARSWLEPLSGEEREVFLQLMSKITLLAKPGPDDPK